MLEEYIPFDRNPMELVKVKQGSKRLKRITIIAPEQFKALVVALSEPHNLMVLMAGCLGLRVSEILALKWTDLDYSALTVRIERVYTQPDAGQPKE